MNDQELTAEARRVAAELRRRPGDRELIRYAAGLLAAAAGRLAIHGPTVSGSLSAAPPPRSRAGAAIIMPAA